MVSKEDRTVDLAFSSELPVVRWWGIEILDHSKGAMRMTRAKNGLAMLFNHERNVHLGKVTDIGIDGDKVGRGVGRFGKSKEAEERFQDVQDDILTDVSVGYNVLAVKEIPAKELSPDLMEMAASEKLPVYRVTDWEPFECSLVTVAADPTVGVGRTTESGDEKEKEIPKAVEDVIPPEEKKDDKTSIMEDRKMGGENKKTEGIDLVQYEKDMETQRTKAGTDAKERERLRVQGINDIYEKFKSNIPEFMRRKAVDEDTPLQDFQDMVLKRLGNGEPLDTPITELGMTHREIKRYSLTRAILSQWKDSGVDCSFELSCSKEIEKKLGGHAEGRGGVFIPYDTYRKPAQTRDLSIVGGDAAGGYLVGTDHLGSEFIDILRNRMVSRAAGARILSGLRGNVAIPKRTAGAATYWPTEGNAPTEGANTFAQLALTPKTIGANVDYTRNLLLQSNPSVDALITGDFALALAMGIDLAVFHGTGTEQPQGIVGTSGVGATTATGVTFASMLDFQTDLATANALAPGCSYVTTPAVAAILAATVKYSNTNSPLWEGGILESSNVCGFRGFATNQITAGYAIFGDFSQVIIGEWGVLELVVDPYTQSKNGVIQVTAFQSIDVGLRYPAAFSVATSVTAA